MSKHGVCSFPFLLAYAMWTLTLNQDAMALTMLEDPRAGVHATAGILPVSELAVSSDQCSAAMNQLAMTFFTNAG